MPALSTEAAREQAVAQHSDDPFLVLLTLTHETLDEPIYVVRNREPVVSNGRTFIAYPFEIELPTDTDEAPQARITIANVSRRIGRALEKLVTPPMAKIELALASSPDVIERTYEGFEISNVSWTATQMTATLQVRHYWDEPWPRKRVTPSKFPGLFP
jgi:hypothetical protein